MMVQIVNVNLERTAFCKIMPLIIPLALLLLFLYNIDHIQLNI